MRADWIRLMNAAACLPQSWSSKGVFTGRLRPFFIFTGRYVARCCFFPLFGTRTRSMSLVTRYAGTESLAPCRLLLNRATLSLLVRTFGADALSRRFCRIPHWFTFPADSNFRKVCVRRGARQRETALRCRAPVSISLNRPRRPMPHDVRHEPGVYARGFEVGAHLVP